MNKLAKAFELGFQKEAANCDFVKQANFMRQGVDALETAFGRTKLTDNPIVNKALDIEQNNVVDQAVKGIEKIPGVDNVGQIRAVQAASELDDAGRQFAPYLRSATAISTTVPMTTWALMPAYLGKAAIGRMALDNPRRLMRLRDIATSMGL